MTIRIYTGTPGAGKTLHAVEDGLLAQRRPGGVIANFEITKPRVDKQGRTRWIYMREDQMTPAALMAHADRYHPMGKESQGLVIIDEAHRILNSRSSMDRGATGNARSELVRFLSEHRHYGFDVLLVAQGSLMIDKQVRFLIEEEVKHFRMNKLAWWLKWVPIPLFGRKTSNYQYKELGKSLGVTLFPVGKGRYDHQAMRRRVEGGGVRGPGVPAPSTPSATWFVPDSAEMRKERGQGSTPSQLN